MASRFKAEGLAFLDQVERMGISVTVTDHGRPVARLVPLADAGSAASTMGSVDLIAEDDEAYYSTGDDWDPAHQQGSATARVCAPGVRRRGDLVSPEARPAKVTPRRVTN
jgi:prevent-host-death family protein